MVDTQPCLSGHPQLLYWDDPGPSRLEDVSTQDRRTVGEAGPQSPTDSVITTRLPPKTAPPAQPPIHSLGHGSSPSCGSLRPQALDLIETHNTSRVPPFSVLLSLVFPKIPPEPHVPLSLLGAERFQLSDVAQGELDMKLYVSRVRQPLMELIHRCQPIEGSLSAEQIRTPLQFRETTGLVTR